QTVRLWDATARKEQLVLKGHTGGVYWASWSPDGSRLASAGNEGNVLVWDASTGGRITSLRAHPTGASAVCWSPDGRRLATASQDYTVQIHDAGAGFTAPRQAASSTSGKGHQTGRPRGITFVSSLIAGCNRFRSRPWQNADAEADREPRPIVRSSRFAPPTLGSH